MHTDGLIIDSQYFANYNYYKTLIRCSYLYFEQYQNHEKKSFANRCLVAGANGQIVLSIPIDGGRNLKCIFKDIRISNAEQWQKIHWRSLMSGYKASPWFDYYSDELAAIYCRHFEFLLDWNLACFEWTCKVLGMDVNFQCTSGYKEHYDVEGYTDLRNFHVPGAKDVQSGIVYPQVFDDRRPFISGLSILDMLFCVGPTKCLAFLKGA